MVKTAAQKEARKERRKAAKLKAEAHGRRILQAAETSGYEPKGKKFVGVGKYKPKGVVMQRKMKGQGDIIDSLAEGAGNLVRRVGEWGLSKLGGVVKGILGVGDYQKSNAPAENGYIAGAMPKMLGAGGESEVIIAHHEMVTELFAQEDFKVTEYHLNPGLGETFPWLSPQANQYEQYELEAMMVIFIPTLSPFSEAASGDLGMAVDYDTRSIAKTTIAGAANQYLSVFGRPMDKMAMAVECAPKETPVRIKKVRAAEVSAGDAGNDDQWYDHGILRIYQQGQPASTVGQAIGRLYICYKFRFYKPTTEVLDLQSPTAHYKTMAHLAAATPLGTSSADFVPGAGNSLPLTWLSSQAFAMPGYVFQGKWLMAVNWICESGVMRAPFFSNTSGAEGLRILADETAYDNTIQVSGPEYDGTAEKGVTLYTFTVTDAAPTFTCSDAKGVSPVRLEVLITALDVDLVSLHYAKRAHASRQKERERRVQQNYRDSRHLWDRESADIAELRKQIEQLKQHYGDPYFQEEKEEEPPLRLPRKRVTQEVPDDDDESIVSVRTRTSSKNKSGAVTKPE